jgi:hypothetical protein
MSAATIAVYLGIALVAGLLAGGVSLLSGRRTGRR